MVTQTIFPHVPEALPPVAERIAGDMLRLIDAECRRRIGDHCDWWKAVWESEDATPEEIVEIELREQKAIAEKAEIKAKETARQEILDRLGLTADEAKLILG